MRIQPLKLLTRLELVSFLAAAFLLSVLVFGASLERKASSQLYKQNRQAGTFIAKLYSGIGDIHGAANALALLLQSADMEASDVLELYSQSQYADTKAITLVAQFQSVSGDKTQELLDEMSGNGVYNFKISELDADGSRMAASARTGYYPLTHLHPFKPQLAKLLGLDLASENMISNRIEAAIVSNTSVMAPLPGNWPQLGSIILIHPTYLGRYIPQTMQERVSQSNGGFALMLDVQLLLEQAAAESPELDIALELSTARVGTRLWQDSRIAHQPVQNPAPQYFENLFDGAEQSYTIESGLSSLQVTMVGRGGVSPSAVRDAIVAAMVAWIIVSLGAVMLNAWRKTKKAHLDAQRSLEREREIAHITLEAISDAVITVDAQAQISYVNPATEKLLDKAQHDLVGSDLTREITLQHLPDPEHQNAVFYNLEPVLEGRQSNFPELQLINRRSDRIDVDTSFSHFNQSVRQGERGAVMVIRDVSQERSLKRELEYRATHDQVTGIGNRYLFERTLTEIVTNRTGSESHYALCYLDLDQFKIINDTCGHAAGDRLLLHVAKGLKNIIGENDMIARLGGDEFGLVLCSSSAETAVDVAQSIYEYFQQFYFQHEENMFSVRASIGFVHIDNTYSDISELMAAVDIACYSAKDRGRNELVVYSSGSTAANEKRGEMMLLPKVQKALRADSFRLFVQPITEIDENGIGRISHHEILLRMLEDDGSLTTPAQLILAAERYDLMRDVDRWVIGNALRLIAELQANGQSESGFAINLSGQSTADPELPAYIAEQLEQTGVDPKLLSFEITETSAIENMDHTLELIEFLHARGASLALDDFGAGASSFGYLKSLPVDYLKIDGQFIKEICHNEVDREMVRCMQNVAELLGLRTIAEFVENEEIVDQLRELGVNYAQGYHVSKPFAMTDLFINVNTLKKAA